MAPLIIQQSEMHLGILANIVAYYRESLLLENFSLKKNTLLAMLRYNLLVFIENIYGCLFGRIRILICLNEALQSK